MPLYDFECPHGHRFERQCLIAERNEPVPCEGLVNQLLDDDELDKLEGQELPEGYEWVSIDPDSSNGVPAEKVLIKKVPCILQATLVVGTHSNPAACLHHGFASNRDAAREGRYDPLNPNRRFMAKGRGWRK
jgi:hypothetical protein